MSENNELKPSDSNSSSRSTSPAPRGLSIKERMAMFNKQAESANTPAQKQPPPAIGKKPPNWQPTNERKISTGEGKSGLSASDAASSIQRPGGSLKDRMAALQGAFGSGSSPSAPAPASAPAPKPKPLKKPEIPQIEESLVQQPLTNDNAEPSRDKESNNSNDENKNNENETVDDVNEDKDEVETDEAEQERIKKAEITARIARLGGMRLGGPVATPSPASTTTKKSEDETQTDNVIDKQSEESKASLKEETPIVIPSIDTNVKEEVKDSFNDEVDEVDEVPQNKTESLDNVPSQLTSKEPVEELNDQPAMSMKAPPLARRAKPPRRRTPNPKVETNEIDVASSTPLPDTPITHTHEQGSNDEFKEASETVEQDVTQDVKDIPIDGKIDDVAKSNDDEHPGNEHIHRFLPHQVDQFGDKSAEDRRMSVVTALHDKSTPIETAIDHFHSPIVNETTQVETPQEEVEPTSPLPISKPLSDEGNISEKPLEKSSIVESVETGSTDINQKNDSELNEGYETKIDDKDEVHESLAEPRFSGIIPAAANTSGVEIKDSVSEHIEHSEEPTLEEQKEIHNVSVKEIPTNEANTHEGQVSTTLNNDQTFNDSKNDAELSGDGEATLRLPNDNEGFDVEQTQERKTEDVPVNSNTKASITERMAKISMAGGFKFGPAPPILNKPKHDDKYDENVEGTLDDDKDVKSDNDMEKTTVDNENEDTNQEELPEETDEERRAKIAKRLAASGTLRSVVGAPDTLSTTSQPQTKLNDDNDYDDDFNDKQLYDNDDNSDNDDMKKLLKDVQKDVKLDDQSDAESVNNDVNNVIETIPSKEEKRKSIPKPSRELPSVDTTINENINVDNDTSNELSEKRKSIPLPSRDLPPVINTDEPNVNQNVDETDENENELKPKSISSRPSSITSPPIPNRNLPNFPQSPPKRSIPQAPPISTNFDSDDKSIGSSPSISSPPTRAMPNIPTSPPKIPLVPKRPSITSPVDKSSKRSSIGSVMDQQIPQVPPPIPKRASIGSSISQKSPSITRNSSIGSSTDIPTFPDVPQRNDNFETNEQQNETEASEFERKKRITERLAASGGIRPLVGGLPAATPKQHHDTNSEPTEELKENEKTNEEDVVSPESDAERRARIAKKLAMQGSIRPLVGGSDIEQQHKSSIESENVNVKKENEKEISNDNDKEIEDEKDIPPPLPPQRPVSMQAQKSRPTSIQPPPPPSRLPPQPNTVYEKDNEINEDKQKSSEDDFVRVPSQQTLSVTTPKTERESFELVTPPRDDIPMSPSTPGKSPRSPRPVGKHIYTHDELLQLSQSIGKKVNEMTKAQYELSRSMPIADGTSIGFVTETLAMCNAANDPIQWKFGHLIYAQNNEGIVKRYDDPRPGDVLVLKNSEFKGRKALGQYKSVFGTNSPQVAFVTEYELKKGKVVAIKSSSQANHYPTLESISVKFGDLKEGYFEIFRPVPLS